MGVLPDHWITLAGVGIGSGAAFYYLTRPRGPPVPPPEETDFGAYLRDLSVGLPEPVQQNKAGAFEDTSFEAYLRTGAFKNADLSAEQHGPSAAAPQVAADAIPIAIVFGTEFGFSEEVADRLVDRIKAAGNNYEPIVVDMADHTGGLPALTSQQALFVICSTQGDGVPPGEGRGFCTWLSKLSGNAFAGVPFSVCALGDTAYSNFCRCGRTIDTQLDGLGATRIVPRMDINREDYAAIDSWIDAVVGELGTLELQTAGELEGSPGAELWSEQGVAGLSGQERKKGWSRSRPFMARIAAVGSLCNVQNAADKDTIRIEFDLGDSGLTYIPGDAVGIWPSNDSKEVERVLGALGSDGNVQVPVPRWHYTDPRLAESAETMSLREALSRCYDLRQPKLELLAVLREEALKSSRNTATLDELVASSEAGEACLEPRHVADVLLEFGSVPLKPEILLSTLRQLAPRLYSISSSQLEGPGQVQATVAVVRYSSLGLDRIGVCSTDLAARLAVGDLVPIYIHANPDFRLPAESSTPIIMVGPGTGLAPFRSFLKERELLIEGREHESDALLFFGCRRRDQDYLYRSLLEEWRTKGHIELHTAFSREQPGEKVYVQHHLLEAADRVWELLDQRGAHFYVCGDAAAMAVDVERALLNIIGRHKGPEAAQSYLDALGAAGRYQRDVWF